MNEPMNTVFIPVGLLMVGAKLAWNWYKQRKTQRDYSEFAVRRPTARRPTKKAAPQAAHGTRQAKQPKQADGQHSAAMSRLIAGCFGDKGKAERLIAYEMTKGARTRDAAIAAAIDRLARDRAR